MVEKTLFNTPATNYNVQIAPPVTSNAFKQAFSRLAAGVCVLTTRTTDGQNIGLTVTAVTSVSAEPPMLLICLGHWSRATEPLQSGMPFTIHVLNANQQHLAQHFATQQHDKFASIPHEFTAAGCPRLPDALACIECQPEHVYPGGDHSIVIGRITAIHLGNEEAPLLYFARQFHTLSQCIA